MTEIKKQRFKTSFGLWSQFQHELNTAMDAVANFPCGEEEDLERTYWNRIKQNCETFCLFAYEDEKPIGMLCYGEHKKHIDIRDFYVKREHRSKGVGKLLFEEVKKIKSGRIIHVGTVGGNERVLKLYEELGFKMLGYNLQLN